MNKSKMLTDGALLTAIFVVIQIIALFIPIIALVSVFLLPIPFILFSYRYSWKPTLIMFAAVLILTALFATAASIPVTLIAAFGGMMIGTAIHSKSSAYETWARGTVGFVVGLLLSLLIMEVAFDINFAETFEKKINESIELSKGVMGQFGGEITEQAEAQFQFIEDQLAVMKDLLPIMLVILGLFLALVSEWIGFKVINRMEGKQLKFPPFRSLRFPVAIVWIYFFAIIATLFQPEPGSIVYLVAQNVLILAGFFMIIQGFSFIFFYTHHKNLTKAVPVIFIILILFFSVILLPFVRILGIIDIGFGLRNWVAKK